MEIKIRSNKSKTNILKVMMKGSTVEAISILTLNHFPSCLCLKSQANDLACAYKMQHKIESQFIVSLVFS